MKKILFAVILLAGFYCSNAQYQIVGYEYWFDNQYDQKTTASISPTEQWMMDLDIPVNILTNGMHIFSYRTFDNTGKYSSPLSYFFYKIPEQITATRKEIVAWEYWFNNDYIEATLVNASGLENLSINEWVNLQHLPTGIHTLNIRFKDNSHIWSSVSSQFFYKTPERTSSSGREIVAYEYWFDNDYSNAVFVNMPGLVQQNLNEFIPLNYVPTGFHAFNIRFLDNSNLWSSPVSQFMYKVPGWENLTQNSITEYQYWFDNNFEQVNKVKMPTPLPHVSLIDNLDLSQLSKGTHTIHFQFKDTLGLWSVVTTDTCYVVNTVNIIESSFNQHFKVYPNPTTGKVYIDFGMNMQNIRAEVYNLEGKLLLQQKIPDTWIFEMDIDEPAGIYLLKITSGKETATLKLIKY